MGLPSKETFQETHKSDTENSGAILWETIWSRPQALPNSKKTKHTKMDALTF